MEMELAAYLTNLALLDKKEQDLAHHLRIVQSPVLRKDLQKQRRALRIERWELLRQMEEEKEQ